MPAKMNPNDWDRLFAPNAPRPGGPIGAAINILLIGVVLAIVTFGTQYFFAQREAQIAGQIANATLVAATSIPQQTEAAVAFTATEAARVETATARANPTAAPVLGIGAVNQGGNLRSQPVISPETVVGLIWQGDQIQFLEQRDVDGQPWYRIRITRLAPNRGEGVAVNSEGWASASLLSPVSPAP
jgi:Bacterial SH3 domain